MDCQNQPHTHLASYLLSRFPNHFKDTCNHEAQAKQGEVLGHQCNTCSAFLLHQKNWSTLVYEISNNVCSYITYTKESSFDLETSPFDPHKLYNLCDIFQAMLHISIDTRFAYHTQSYHTSIYLKVVYRMGLSSNKAILWFFINVFRRKLSRWLPFFVE